VQYRYTVEIDSGEADLGISDVAMVEWLMAATLRGVGNQRGAPPNGGLDEAATFTVTGPDEVQMRVKIDPNDKEGN